MMRKRNTKFLRSPLAKTPKWLLVAFVILIAGLISQKEISSIQNKYMDGSTSKYVEMAISDLVNRLKIGREQIVLKDISKKDWSNTSLGCPKKNMIYAQVIVPGYLITLNASGNSYIYHAGSNRVVSCQSN